MKAIDKEIFEVETRLRAREATIRQTLVDTRKRTVKSLKSPITIAAAVALGFFAAGRIGRRREEPAVQVSQETKEQGKGFAIGTLLMTGITWIIRSQFGGPVGAAQWVIAKLKERKSPAAYQP